MGKVLFSGFRFSHHNVGSGYDGVVVNLADYVRGDMLPLGTLNDTNSLRKLNYLLTDAVTMFRGLNYSTIIYFYPEHSAFMSPLFLKFLGKKIIYVIHLHEDFWLSPSRTPFGWLKRKSFRHSDIIISLSSEQTKRIKRIFPDKQVHFIPHGLDMASTAPDDESLQKRLEQLNVVVVGNNYRDFELLEAIIRSRPSHLPLTFHLVGLDSQNQSRFAGMSYVVCHSRLTAAAYEELLRSSLMMVLPLTFATANNALLEAHKFYLPSACSDIQGVRDYATNGTFFFNNPVSFWDIVNRITSLSLSAYREICFKTHFEACTRFSWQEIHTEINNCCEID